MKGGWSAWLRNGRLATIALVIVFVTWLGFQVFAGIPPTILDQVLLYAVGVWFGNIAIQKGRSDEKAEAAATDVAKKVERLEAEADERGERDG